MKLTNHREPTNKESSTKSKIEFKPMIYQPRFFLGKKWKKALMI